MEVENLKVLVAEDNKVNQVVICKMLTIMGVDSDLVSNGNEAVKLATDNAYDLIFMDVQMPVMDGIEATRVIRKELGDSEKPFIVALTANAFRENKEECLKAGMNDFLPKPIDLNQLRECMKKWSNNMA